MSYYNFGKNLEIHIYNNFYDSYHILNILFFVYYLSLKSCRFLPCRISACSKHGKTKCRRDHPDSSFHHLFFPLFRFVWFQDIRPVLWRAEPTFTLSHTPQQKRNNSVWIKSALSCLMLSDISLYLLLFFCCGDIILPTG